MPQKRTPNTIWLLLAILVQLSLSACKVQSPQMDPGPSPTEPPVTNVATTEEIPTSPDDADPDAYSKPKKIETPHRISEKAFKYQLKRDKVIKSDLSSYWLVSSELRKLQRVQESALTREAVYQFIEKQVNPRLDAYQKTPHSKTLTLAIELNILKIMLYQEFQDTALAQKSLKTLQHDYAQTHNDLLIDCFQYGPQSLNQAIHILNQRMERVTHLKRPQDQPKENRS